MKSSSYIVPLSAFVLGAGWLGWRHYSIAVVEEANAGLSRQLGTAAPALAEAPPSAPVVRPFSGLMLPDGRPDWSKVALTVKEIPGSDDYDVLRLALILQGALAKLQAPELVAEAGKIAALDESEAMRANLAQNIVTALAPQNPALVVKTFAVYPVQNTGVQMMICEAFALWLQVDSAEASHWLEETVQQGGFPVKSATGWNPLLLSLRGAQVGASLEKDPAAAEALVKSIPAADREKLFDGRLIAAVPDAGLKALVGLIERTVPAKARTGLLMELVQQRLQGDAGNFSAGDVFLGSEGESPEDRRTLIRTVVSGMSLNADTAEKIRQALDPARRWIASKHPEDVGPVTGAVLGDLVATSTFEDAAQMVEVYQGKDGPDSGVLESFLATDGAKLHATAALKLAGQIADPARREVAIKSLEEAKAANDAEGEEGEEDK